MKHIRGWLPMVCLVAFSGLGCGGGSKHACTPDLTVNWAIVISGSNTSASCGDVGASNIRVTIDGQSMDFVCPAAQSSGSILAQLDVSGSHAVSVTLLSGTSPLGPPASTTVNVDCSGQTGTPNLTVGADVGCTPDLTISWQITSSLDGSTLTCAQAGNSNTVNARISGGGLAGPTDFPGPCPANADNGSFVALLPSDGTYSVTLQLLSGSTLISQTNALAQSVDCSGQSATPVADLNAAF